MFGFLKRKKRSVKYIAPLRAHQMREISKVCKKGVSRDAKIVSAVFFLIYKAARDERYETKIFVDELDKLKLNISATEFYNAVIPILKDYEYKVYKGAYHHPGHFPKFYLDIEWTE